MKTYAKDAEAISAKQGETFKVQLPTQTGGGYTWDAKPEAGKLRLVSRVVHPGKAIGGEAITEFTFAAEDAGETKLEFQYGRPWESTSLETCQMRVTVKP